MNLRMLLRALLPGLAAGILLASPGLAQEQGWDKVVAAAKQEGKLVLYGAQSPVTTERAKLFETTYGIPVDLLALPPAEFMARIRADEASGRAIGDVATAGYGGMTRLEEAGMFEPYGNVPLAARVEPPFKNDGTMMIDGAVPYGILYNTDLVPPADAPKRWSDLFAPRWRGKILANDMRRDGGGIGFFGATYDTLGPEFHRKLAAQKVTFGTTPTVDERRVAAGEYLAYIPMPLSDYSGLKGLPVRLVMPEEGATYVLSANAILKGAPHPNAARLYLNFVMSDPGQLIQVRLGRTSAVRSLNAQAPADLKPFLQAKLLGTVDPAKMAAQMKIAAELYK